MGQIRALKVRYTKRALGQMTAILAYIGERSPKGAQSVRAGLKAAIDRLADGNPRTDTPDHPDQPQPGGSAALGPRAMLTPARIGGAPTLTVVVPCYNERANVAPLAARLDATLHGIRWEVVFVDDNSPDGTAAEVRRIGQADPRIRCIRRIGRRGLASAVIEGALSSSAQYVAVIDGDLQHDETRLPEMLTALQSGSYDLAVGSRHVAGGDDAGLPGRWRHLLSDGGIRLAQMFLPVRLSDPMSGFFMMPRPLFEQRRGQIGQFGPRGQSPSRLLP